MKKENSEMLKKQILELRKKGLTYRKIQKELNLSSTSVVDYYLKKSNKELSNWITKLVLLPIRVQPEENRASDAYMCTGFNAYREELINILKKEGLYEHTTKNV